MRRTMPLESGAPGATRWGKGPGEPDVRRFLQGPQRRGFELARAIRIFLEFMRGSAHCTSRGRA
jgi:hypothetical protein